MFGFPLEVAHNRLRVTERLTVGVQQLYPPQRGKREKTRQRDGRERKCKREKERERAILNV